MTHAYGGDITRACDMWAAHMPLLNAAVRALKILADFHRGHRGITVEV